MYNDFINCSPTSFLEKYILDSKVFDFDFWDLRNIYITSFSRHFKTKEFAKTLLDYVESNEKEKFNKLVLNLYLVKYEAYQDYIFNLFMAKYDSKYNFNFLFESDLIDIDSPFVGLESILNNDSYKISVINSETLEQLETNVGNSLESFKIIFNESFNCFVTFNTFDYSDMDDYIIHDFNFLTYCSRLYLYSALFSKDKYLVQQSNIYQIYLQLFSAENLNEINDERVKKMVFSLKDSIFNLIVNPFGEAMKFVSLPYKFNLKDEFKHQVLSSPFMEDKKGVYLYSVDSVVKKDKIESLRDDIENYIGCSVSIYAEKGYIFVCKGGFSDKAFESVKSSPVLDKTTVNNGYIYYGVTSDGVKIGRSIEDDKHLLLVGQSGSGKSVLQQALIYQLKNNIEYIDEMILVDLKGGVEFFQHQGDKISVVYEIEKLADVVGGLVETVRARLDYMRENGLKNYDGKKIYLMIDEYAQIAYHKPLGREQKEIHNSLLTNLNKLSTLGRACGVRLICGLQKCTTSEMDSGFKNNLHDRIIMKSNSNLIFSEVFGTSDFGEGVKLPKPSKFKAGEMLAWIDGERVPSHVKGFLINE